MESRARDPDGEMGGCCPIARRSNACVRVYGAGHKARGDGDGIALVLMSEALTVCWIAGCDLHS